MCLVSLDVSKKVKNRFSALQIVLVTVAATISFASEDLKETKKKKEAIILIQPDLIQILDWIIGGSRK